MVKVYTADTSAGGCGHQHKTPTKARRCARNFLHTHPTVMVATIQRVTLNGQDAPRESTIDTITKSRCTECGGELMTDNKFEWGHLLDCPMVSG